MNVTTNVARNACKIYLLCFLLCCSSFLLDFWRLCWQLLLFFFFCCLFNALGDSLFLSLSFLIFVSLHFYFFTSVLAALSVYVLNLCPFVIVGHLILLNSIYSILIRLVRRQKLLSEALRIKRETCKEFLFETSSIP